MTLAWIWPIQELPVELRQKGYLLLTWVVCYKIVCIQLSIVDILKPDMELFLKHKNPLINIS